MSDDPPDPHPLKNYEMRQGEILVLEVPESELDPWKREESGRVGKISGIIKKSDFGSGIRSHTAHAQKELERERRRQYRRFKQQTRRDALKRAQIYVPADTNNAEAYGELTAVICDIIGGVPDEVLHQTAYDLLKLLKTPNLSDEARINGIKDIICKQPSYEAIVALSQSADKITDFHQVGHINMDEADEEGVVSITEDMGGDFEYSSSSDSDNDDNGVAIDETGNSGWNLDMLSNYCDEHFLDENGNKNSTIASAKLDEILTVLRNYEGSQLEVQLFRVFGPEGITAIQAIVAGKETILQTKKPKQTGHKRLDLSKYVFDEGSHLITISPDIPKGTAHETYTEIFVPAPPRAVGVKGTVPITSLPDFVRVAFPDHITALNSIQSEVWETAVNTDENILVSAPTGAGKTVVALLCILREFALEGIHKVIYIAPMKSLVQEMVRSFTQYLTPLGKTVAELTGDSSASKSQLQVTDVIVTTPEKWDIITRKVGARTLTEKVSLVIVDEIHLLHDTRGPVLESVVARMQRTSASNGQRLRMVGLSATMPNYEDIAAFMKVSPEGIKAFGEDRRPCPLDKTFIGVKTKSGLQTRSEMNRIANEIVSERAKEGTSTLVFIHSRRETVETSKDFIDRTVDAGTSDYFISDSLINSDLVKEVHNEELRECLSAGFGFHHAGLEANDRKIVEELFRTNRIKVLCCTATLAWGVNLPAHTVIIKGTRVYNPETSGWENLSHLDVLQMFGRAGRPSYDTKGEDFLLTEYRELPFYVSVLTNQVPIESHFLRNVANHLNAEISLGSIATIRDAVEWLHYTYLYVRMIRAPSIYRVDPNKIEEQLFDIAHSAALDLAERRLIRYDESSGLLQTTDIGRIASNFYITEDTMFQFASDIKDHMSDITILKLFTMASEFKNISVRPEERAEVSKLIGIVPIPVKEASDDKSAKINVLLQCYICRLPLRGFSLMADLVYISQSAERLMRCLYELALTFGYADTALSLLGWAKMVGRRMWEVQSPLRQLKEIPDSIVAKLEVKSLPWNRYFDLQPAQLAQMIDPKRGDKIAGELLYSAIQKFPRISKLEVKGYLATPTMIKVDVHIETEFQFDPEVHLVQEPFWCFLLDGESEYILHRELFLVKESVMEADLSFTAPIATDPPQPYYFVKIISDRWIPCEAKVTLPIFTYKIEPDTTIYKDPQSHGFNEVIDYFTQEQKNVLFAAPANSGLQNIVLSIIDFLIGNNVRTAVVIPEQDKFNYLSQDFVQKGFERLSGDPARDSQILNGNCSVVMMPDMYLEVTKFDVFIFYDMHLVGDRRYSSYEGLIALLIAFRLSVDSFKPTFFGLSVPISDTQSLGQWIGCEPEGIFAYRALPENLRFSMKIMTFDYPTSKARKLAMSRPTYAAVSTSPTSIVFVSSVSSAFETAAELIRFEAMSGKTTVLAASNNFKDEALKTTVRSGIAVFHRSLCEEDKHNIYELFGYGIDTIIVPLESVWELRITAPSVVLKGTDIYDGIKRTHIEAPIVDIIEAVSHTSPGGVFNLFTHTARKDMYIAELSGPLPIESAFEDSAEQTLNRAVCIGPWRSIPDLFGVFASTYYFGRMYRNKSYYGIVEIKNNGQEEDEADPVSSRASEVMDSIIDGLTDKGFCELEEDDEGGVLTPTPYGILAAKCNIQPVTAQILLQNDAIFDAICNADELIDIFVASPKEAEEFAEAILQRDVRPINPSTVVKAILTAYMQRIKLPESLAGQLQHVLVGFIRVANAVVEASLVKGILRPAIAAIQLLQRVVQALPASASELLQIPHVTQEVVSNLNSNGIVTIAGLVDRATEDDGDVNVRNILGIPTSADDQKWDEICEFCNGFPIGMTKTAVRQGNEVVIKIERDDDPVPLRSPNLPIEKAEAWWIIVADTSLSERSPGQMFGARRIVFGREVEIRIPIPADTPKDLNIYMMCDSYIGADGYCKVN